MDMEHLAKVVKVPEQLIKDFLTFTDYLTSQEVGLTKSRQWLSRNNLLEINARMSVPEEGRTKTSDQDTYPLLHLYYHICIAAGFFSIIQAKSGKATLERTERLSLFLQMNETEQYMCLLETFWVDVNWDDLQYGERYSPGYGVSILFEQLLKCPFGAVITVSDNSDNENLVSFLYRWNYFMHYFTYFGFWELTKDEKRSAIWHAKYHYVAQTITPSLLLYQLGAVLIETRDLRDWNLQLRRDSGDWRGDSDEPFIESFKPLFPIGELVSFLPRLTGIFVDGTYDLKISLHLKCWRTIRISSHQTLHQLHIAIQSAFDLDNDHLYAFFMDGQSWSRFAFYSPDDGEEPGADEAELGELNLTIGQTFLYLFDYGDEWHFQIRVESVSDMNTKGSKPQVLDGNGGSPKRYS
ncbi:plasmid pRiA4b ORF-3 family protein [Paenibacillus oryzisoli]|uniref:Plasmid pRiA4b Orf3-like domain-containing protein n=1 Tax=Paenibacillus oryzisoli TaxID=1850517 RepID=A0A198AJE7_9BACL|nr:plasmid pRiA4b ORF-3 family protein [Paenibacillus oryzisoli]OAS21352.1 hypothetical protein A8708_31265 [Paenibacillus oryzisoli]